MADELWTIGKMIDWMQGYLEKHGDPNPRISCQWLLSDATKLERIELYMNLDRPLSAQELDTLRQGVRRRSSGEPLQYITGCAHFRYLDLEISEGVLIPRPETEILVSVLLEELDRRCEDGFSLEAKPMIGKERFSDPVGDTDKACFKPQLSVLDLCTGSGCIALSLAYERDNINCVAIDNSEKAIELAQANAHRSGLEDKVQIVKHDVFDDLSFEPDSFDAISSNPPYIPTDVLVSLSREVSEYEPRCALDGGADGLGFLDRILDLGLSLLKPGGAIAIELFEDRLDAALTRAQEKGYIGSKVVYDLTDKPRVLFAKKPC